MLFGSVLQMLPSAQSGTWLVVYHIIQSLTYVACYSGSNVYVWIPGVSEGVHELLHGVTLLFSSLSMIFLYPQFARIPFVTFPEALEFAYPLLPHTLHLYPGSSGGRTQRGKQQQGFAPPSPLFRAEHSFPLDF